jgi:hypothetical protein
VKRPRASPAPRFPWEHGFLESRKVSLIKAMASQHPEAFRICVEEICRTNSLSFTAGGEEGRRATDFAEGMRFAGRAMLNARDAVMPTTGRKAPPDDLPNSPTPPPAMKS